MTPAARRGSAEVVVPRIMFVLGKGGVGRSTVALGVASALAARGQRALVVEWAAADPLAAWFRRPPLGPRPEVLAPNLSALNYRLDETLRAYFVDHLHLPRFHRRVIQSRIVERFLAAAPGIAELLFLGQLWWLTTLAEAEVGLAFDHVVVDAPATGHGLALFDLPGALGGLGPAGLLGLELERVRAMLADPRWSGALVVTLAEELAVEETRALLPRLTAALARPPLLLAINRSAEQLRSDPAALDALAVRLPAPAGLALRALDRALARRRETEREVAEALGPLAAHGALGLPEQVGLPGEPEELARRLGLAILARLGGAT